MNGYVAQRRGRSYAVIYEGRDPLTGKEHRLAPWWCRELVGGDGLPVRRTQLDGLWSVAGSAVVSVLLVRRRCGFCIQRAFITRER